MHWEYVVIGFNLSQTIQSFVNKCKLELKKESIRQDFSRDHTFSSPLGFIDNEKKLHSSKKLISDSYK